MSDPATLSADVEVMDDGGVLLATVSGLHLKRRNPRSAIDQQIYNVRWRAAEVRATSEVRTKNWTIVSDNAEAGEKLAEALRLLGCRAVVSKPGERLRTEQDLQGRAARVRCEQQK